MISRFNFPDLRQLSPHEPSLTEHGGRVRVMGEPRRRSSVVGKLNRFLNNKILQKRLSFFRIKKILWPHSSQLPRTKCHNFLVQLFSSQLQPSCRLSCPGAQFPGRKKNFAILKLNRTHPQHRLQRVPSTPFALPRPSSTSMAAARATPPVVRACFPLESKICLRRTFFQSANSSLLLSSATPRNCRYQGQK